MANCTECGKDIGDSDGKCSECPAKATNKSIKEALDFWKKKKEEEGGGK